LPDLKPGYNPIRMHGRSREIRIQTMFEKGLLAGKRILVTGGGSGLGAAMGRRFVELGAELIICGRRLELLEAVAAEMRSAFGGTVSVARCDIRDGAAVDAMMDQLWREAAIDVLVNNAAATFIAQTEQMSFRAADAILAPTLHGTMYCTLAAGRRWIEGKHKGVVLSILSTSTITGRAFTVPSAMAKSAVLAMTKSLAVEWGPKGVRTVAIAPGAFPTPGASGQLRPEGRDESWAQRNPLGRAGAEDLVTAFPKRHFPAIHRAAWRDVGVSSGHLPVTMMREPVVRAANTVIPCCECVAVRGVGPCAGADGRA
jgi:NAD(P)-dependent dehydrogenase (short-subunit alcohol dehydrogenase family)